MWCHLVLAMPLLGIGLFWVLPWPVALPAYAVIALSSLLLYRQLMLDLGATPKVGREALNGRGMVLEMLPQGSWGTHLVRLGAERWIARASQELRPGDEVYVVGLDGMCLLVQATSVSLEGAGDSSAFDSALQMDCSTPTK